MHWDAKVIDLRVVFLFLAFTLSGVSAALAEQTPIVVRVLARDGKFIGSSMGGVRVLIRDADTGEVLAQGATEGETGDTRVLMQTPRARGERIARDADARFAATIEVAAPRRVTVEVYGPLAQLQSAVSASSTQWVLPGRAPHGPDGWIIELPGLAVDVIAPAAYDRGFAAEAEAPIEANVMLMCGCGIEPNGLWDSNRYQVRFQVVRDGRPFAQGDLSYAGSISRFQGVVRLGGAGTYEIMVSAYDPATGNAGVDHHRRTATAQLMQSG